MKSQDKEKEKMLSESSCNSRGNCCSPMGDDSGSLGEPKTYAKKFKKAIAPDLGEAQS